MLQEIIIAAIFLMALGYVIYIIRKSFSAKESNCSKGCSCSSIDLDKIEKEINAGKR